MTCKAVSIQKDRSLFGTSKVQPLQQYVWSPVGENLLVGMDRTPEEAGAGVLSERHYIQQDPLGNVTALVSPTGAVEERYAYDPYGLIS